MAPFQFLGLPQLPIRETTQGGANVYQTYEKVGQRVLTPLSPESNISFFFRH